LQEEDNMDTLEILEQIFMRNIGKQWSPKYLKFIVSKEALEGDAFSGIIHPLFHPKRRLTGEDKYAIIAPFIY